MSIIYQITLIIIGKNRSGPAILSMPPGSRSPGIDRNIMALAGRALSLAGKMNRMAACITALSNICHRVYWACRVGRRLPS